MGWETSIFTRAGIALIHRCIDDGKQLILTSAYAGEDVFADGAAADATAMAGTPKQQLPLNITVGDAGQDVYLTVASAELAEGYQLRQIGVFAKADGDSDETLLFLMQDETGFAIPSASEMPYFSLTVTACLNLADAADLEIRQTCLITPSDGTVTTKKLAAGAVTKAKLGSDVAGELDTLELQFSSPYNFKGTVAAAADLPSSGNTVNDTYYVEALKYRMTWNGSAWSQSSLDEGDYEDELAALNEALYNSVKGLENINNEHFFGNEIQFEMLTGTRGSSTGSSVAVTASNAWMCSTLIPVEENDILTFVNLMPEQYRFVVRGYSDNEANNGVFVSGGGPLALYPDGTQGANLGSIYSNEILAVYKNTIAVGKQVNTTSKYLSVHVRRLTGTTRTQNDVENIQKCFKIYSGNQMLNEYYMPTVRYDKRTVLGDYGELVSYAPFVIDTVNLTGGFGNSSFTLKSGRIRKNNPIIDFSNLNTSVHQTIYYDINAEKILVTDYGSYINLPNVNDTIYLGSGWQSNSRYPDGYFQINGCPEVVVNGRKQLNNYDYNHADTTFKSIVMFGDSILQGQTTGESGVKTQYLLQDLIPIQFGIDATNLAVGGSGWCHRENRTSDLAVKVPATDVSGYDYILFFSGTNDYGAGLAVGNVADAASNAVGAGFCASVKYVLDNVFTQNPDVEIAIVTPTFRNYQSSGGTGNTYTTVQNQSGNTLGDFCDALVEIGELYNIPVYDMRKNSCINFKNYATMLHEQSEGSAHYLHPKDATYRIMNHKIMEWLKTVL